MELKPCPFCGYGGEPEIMTWREPYRSNIVYGVQCMACGAIGEMGKTRELAAKNWNERAEREVDRLQTENAKLRELVRDMWFWHYEGHIDSESQERQMKHIDRVIYCMRELGVDA